MSNPKPFEIKPFLEVRGYEYVDFKETKKNNNCKIEQNLYSKLFSSNRYFLVNAKAISDNSDKQYYLVLKYSSSFFGKNRDFFYFENIIS